MGRPPLCLHGYVDGEDLASLLRRIGRFSPDKALEIVRQVCAGLAAAHERGVLHRDLKLANVMLDGRGKVRITDFGLASFADDDHVGEIAGTPAYMAPEQIAGGKLSPQTDLYAVGLLLFELLSGTPVHSTASFAERQQHPPPPLPASVRAAVDPRIAQVIDRCLEPNFTRRPGPHSQSLRRCPEPGAPRWEHLQSLRPQLVVFWYRSSPHPLVHPLTAQFGYAPFIVSASSAEALTAVDATTLDPGGSYLELDPDDALSGLLIMPSSGPAPAPANGRSNGTDCSQRPGSIPRCCCALPRCRSSLCWQTLAPPGSDRRRTGPGYRCESTPRHLADAPCTSR